MKQRFLSLRLKIEKFIKEQLWEYVLVLSSICLFAWLFNKPIEAVMFVITHLVLRPKFNRQYHSGFISVCLLITISIAFFGILFCLPLKVSLLSAIPLACFICWIGDTLQCKIELALENKRLRDANKPKPFNVDTCTEAELLERCLLQHLSAENTELAIEFFIRKTKQSVIAEQLCIDEKSVTTRKKRLKKKLNKI